VAEVTVRGFCSNDCAALLQQNLDQEKAVDEKLTAMAPRAK